MAKSKCCFDVYFVQILGIFEISVSHLPWHQYIYMPFFQESQTGNSVIYPVILIFIGTNFEKFQVFGLEVCMQNYNHTLMRLSIYFGK